ncbi:MAG TPA: hypothetical protein VM008_17320 [Phycisphaerae bacterium]|nr:hypothetical protein [Phycisphaerae bacterium]
MPFVANSITGKIDLDGKPSVEAIKAVAGESGKMAEAVVRNANQASEMSAAAAKRGAESEVRTYKEKLESLKGMAGRRSAFGETMELLAGGGAIMGFSIAAEKMGEMVKGATELKQQLAEGKINSFDMAEGFAKMIPVFGQFYSVGRGIREMITGENAEIAEATSRVQEQNEAWNRTQEIIKKAKETVTSFGDEIRSAKDQLELLGAGQGPARDRVLIEQEKQKSLRENDALYDPKTQADKIAEANKRVTDLTSQMTAKDQEIAAINANKTTSLGNAALGGGALGLGFSMGAGKTGKDLDAAQKERSKIIEQRTAAMRELQTLQGNDLELRQKQADAKVAIEAVAAERIRQLEATAAKEAAAKIAEQKAAAQKELDQIKKEADQAGMTESQKKIDDLKRSGKYTPDQINQAAGDLAKIDQQKQIDGMKEAAKALHESLESPTEKLQDTVAKYKQMLKDGLISQEDYDKATLKASEDALGGKDALKSQNSAALIRSGSAQSQAAAYASKYDKNSVMESLAKQQLAKLSIVAEHVGTLAGHTNEQPDTLHDMAGIA